MKGLIPILLVSPILLAAVAWVVSKEIAEYRRAKESESWPSVRGRVEGIATEFHPGARHKRRGYTVKVAYSYAVEGRSYRSERVQFMTEAERHPDEAAARAAVAEFPPGPVTVYYDPRKPAEATLVRRYRLLWTTAIPVLAGVAIPLFFLGLVLYGKFRR